jgi:N-acyl-D-amino-acid deacylase
MLNEGNGHPRAAGTFPRILGKYVREQGTLSLYNAIQKMTELPATRLGIDKGKLSVGSEADITVFDPNSVVDTADFEDPLKPPAGIRYVIIKGEIALENGEILRSDLGRSIRA